MLLKWGQRISRESTTVKLWCLSSPIFNWLELLASDNELKWYRTGTLIVSVFPGLRDPFMVLSGGLSYDTVGRRACLTVMHGKSTTVLEMDFPIVDFLTLCETPYPNGELQHCAVDEFRPLWMRIFASIFCLSSPQIFRNPMLWWFSSRRI